MEQGPRGVTQNKHSTGLLLLLATIGIGWGLTVSLATIATATGHHPISVAFWSAVVGVLLLTVILAVRRVRPPMDRVHLRFYLISGLLGTALPHALSFYAAIHLPAGLRAIVFALIPMLTLSLSIVWALEKPNLRRFTGIAFGFLAIVLLFDFEDMGSLTGQAFWMLVSLAAAASYATENVYIVLQRPRRLDALTALWGMTLAATGMLGAVAVAMGVSLTLPAHWGQAEAAVVLMAAIHVSCYATLLFILHRAGGVFASQVAYIVTPAGVFWGVILLSEEVTLAILVSTAFVLLGLTLIRPNPKPSSDPVAEECRR